LKWIGKDCVWLWCRPILLKTRVGSHLAKVELKPEQDIAQPLETTSRLAVD
jgi:hypothetical protein